MMTDFTEWSALWISLKVALFCLVWIAPPGIAIAWLLARKRFRFKVLLETLVYLPLVLPPIVTGYLLLLLFGRKGWVGAWLDALFGVQLGFNLAGAVLAAGVMSFPLLVRSARLGFELVEPGLEIAAATLGASCWRTFLKVTLPLAAPGLLTGLTLAFVRGLGEFGATITFAGNIEGETRTIPLAIFSSMQVPGRENQVLILAGLSVAISFVAMLVSEGCARFLTRRLRGPS